MSPNLRSVVARVFQGRFRQAATRNFSSSPQGESVVVTGLKNSDSSLVRGDDPSLLSWISVGYGVYFVWDAIQSINQVRMLRRGFEERNLESQRIKELMRKNQLSMEQLEKLQIVLKE